MNERGYQLTRYKTWSQPPPRKPERDGKFPRKVLPGRARCVMSPGSRPLSVHLPARTWGRARRAGSGDLHWWQVSKHSAFLNVTFTLAQTGSAPGTCCILAPATRGTWHSCQDELPRKPLPFPSRNFPARFPPPPRSALAGRRSLGAGCPASPAPSPRRRGGGGKGGASRGPASPSPLPPARPEPAASPARPPPPPRLRPPASRELFLSLVLFRPACGVKTPAWAPLRSLFPGEVVEPRYYSCQVSQSPRPPLLPPYLDFIYHQREVCVGRGGGWWRCGFLCLWRRTAANWTWTLQSLRVLPLTTGKSKTKTQKLLARSPPLPIDSYNCIYGSFLSRASLFPRSPESQVPLPGSQSKQPRPWQPFMLIHAITSRCCPKTGTAGTFLPRLSWGQGVRRKVKWPPAKLPRRGLLNPFTSITYLLYDM